MQYKATVMVVDDDPLNLELIELMLLPEGYNVVLVESGAQCLATVGEVAPDTILLDALMPEMSGFDVVRQLKSETATRMIPVVMVTSLSDITDRVEAMEAGADDFLSKPLAKVEVLARVRSLVKVKQYNNRIIESEKRFRDLVQDANVIIVSINDDGKIEFINEYGLDFFEYAVEELQTEPVRNRDRNGQEATFRPLQELIHEMINKSDSQPRFTTETVTKSGRRVWVDWTNRSIVNDNSGKRSFLCVGIDVTTSRRLKMEESRRYERHKIRDILNDGISRRISHVETFGMLQQMGITITLPFMVAVLPVPELVQTELAHGMDLMEWQFQVDYLVDSIRMSGGGVACPTQDGIIVIQSCPNSRTHSSVSKAAKLSVDELVKTVSRCWPGKEVRMGITHSSVEMQNVAELYEQARAAMFFGAVFNPGQKVAHWHDLGCFQFIVKDYRSLQARLFVQEHLGLILDDSRAGNINEDIATLEAIISGDSLQVIADRLHVHRQTIVFRKRKLEDKLGEDLDSLKTRMNLAFAMKLHSLLA